MMKIQVNYWPQTPHLREIKIYVNGNLELSSFNDANEIQEIIDILQNAFKELKEDK